MHCGSKSVTYLGAYCANIRESCDEEGGPGEVYTTNRAQSWKHATFDLNSEFAGSSKNYTSIKNRYYYVHLHLLVQILHSKTKYFGDLKTFKTLELARFCKLRSHAHAQ